MVTVPLVAGLVCGLAVVALAARSRLDGLFAVVACLGFVGVYLAGVAFLQQPWAVPAPLATLDRNLTWLIEQADWLRPLQQAPAIGRVLSPLDLSSPSALRASLEQSSAGPFFRLVSSAQPLFGWHLWQLSWQASPGLGVGLSAALLASLASVVLLVSALVTRALVWPRGGLLVSALAAFGVLLSLMHVATVDTLGSSTHFTVRLVAALAQVRVGPGVWWMLLGLLALVGFGMAYYLLSRRAAAWMSADDWRASVDVYTTLEGGNERLRF